MEDSEDATDRVARVEGALVKIATGHRITSRCKGGGMASSTTAGIEGGKDRTDVVGAATRNSVESLAKRSIAWCKQSYIAGSRVEMSRWLWSWTKRSDMVDKEKETNG